MLYPNVCKYGTVGPSLSEEKLCRLVSEFGRVQKKEVESECR